MGCRHAWPDFRVSTFPAFKLSLALFARLWCPEFHQAFCVSALLSNIS